MRASRQGQNVFHDESPYVRKYVRETLGYTEGLTLASGAWGVRLVRDCLNARMLPYGAMTRNETVVIQIVINHVDAVNTWAGMATENRSE